MHITRVTRFGQEGESNLAPTATSSTTLTKAPRPQPKGLKARYQPFGVTNGATGNVGVDASDDEDVEMAQAPPMPSISAAKSKSDTPKAAKKRKHGDVEKATPSKEEVVATPVKKSKKARVDSSSTQAVKVTPVLPPVPGSSAKTVAPPEPEQASPVKKSKSKDKSKKKDSASTETKKPPKVTPVLPPAVPSVKST